MYRALAEAAGSTANIVHAPSEWLRNVAPRRSVGVWFIYRFPSIYDNTKAERDLGFATTVPLVETLPAPDPLDGRGRHAAHRR